MRADLQERYGCWRTSKTPIYDKIYGYFDKIEVFIGKFALFNRMHLRFTTNLSIEELDEPLVTDNNLGSHDTLISNSTSRSLTASAAADTAAIRQMTKAK
jgi:hypothetical protein